MTEKERPDRENDGNSEEIIASFKRTRIFISLIVFAIFLAAGVFAVSQFMLKKEAIEAVEVAESAVIESNKLKLKNEDLIEEKDKIVEEVFELKQKLKKLEEKTNPMPNRDLEFIQRLTTYFEYSSLKAIDSMLLFYADKLEKYYLLKHKKKEEVGNFDEHYFHVYPNEKTYFDEAFFEYVGDSTYADVGVKVFDGTGDTLDMKLDIRFDANDKIYYCALMSGRAINSVKKGKIKGNNVFARTGPSLNKSPAVNSGGDTIRLKKNQIVDIVDIHIFRFNLENLDNGTIISDDPEFRNAGVIILDESKNPYKVRVVKNGKVIERDKTEINFIPHWYKIKAIDGSESFWYVAGSLVDKLD